MGPGLGLGLGSGLGLGLGLGLGFAHLERLVQLARLVGRVHELRRGARLILGELVGARVEPLQLLLELGLLEPLRAVLGERGAML